MGFMVGRNERGVHLAPSTEVVTPPPAIPPTVNPPAESGQGTSQEPAPNIITPNPAPDTVVVPPGGAGANPAAPAETPATAAAPKGRHQTAANPAPNPPAPPSPAPGEVGEGITLQVAALRTKQDADALVNILRGRGYPVFMVTPEYAHADDNLFRVQVGPFKTRDDADKVRTKLAQEGFKPFIKH